MNKKVLIFYISLAFVLIAGISVGIFSLYRGSGTKGRKLVKVLDRYPVVAAVPSDAMALAVFDSAEDGVSKLLDECSLWGAMVYDSGKNPYYEFLSGIESCTSRHPMAVSLHNCGSTVPVIVFDAGRNAGDSTVFVRTVLREAEKAGLHSAFHRFEGRSYLISSSSAVLVSSSRSHIDDGMSIAVNESFCSCASATSAPAVLFFSNSCSSRLLPSFFNGNVSSNADKIKRLAAWTALSETEYSERKAVYEVSASLNGNSYLKVFTPRQPAECSFAQAAPAGTMFALALPVTSLEEYVDAYDAYMDGQSRMSPVRALRKKLASVTDVKPVEWAKALDIKEVARVQWYRGKELLQACLVRPGQRGCSYIFRGLDGSDEKNYVPSARPYSFAGYAASLFGEDFALSLDPYFVYRDGWIISGEEDAVTDLLSRGSSLKASLSLTCPDILPARAGGMVMYFSSGSCRVNDIFGKALARSIENMLVGASRADASLVMGQEGLVFRVERPLVETAGEAAEITVTGSGLDVPKGPFKVKNCATNKTNTLAQQSNNYLTLYDENGKALWSVEFREPLCGRVVEVDHFSNGKIQFLFAAGSQLWLLDRLGRFVSGFPAALAQNVVLGPALYELPEGRTLAFLYQDGSIGFTDMKGKSREFWKGVRVQGQIIALPELVETEKGRFWVIRTLKEAMIYPFEGGEALYAKGGKDAIRSDSPVKAAEKGGLTVVTNEGKEKLIRL